MMNIGAQNVESATKLLSSMNIGSENMEIATKLFDSLSLTHKKKKTQIDLSNPRNEVFMKLNEILQTEKKSKNLEISIYNWTIQNVKNNKIKPKITKKGRNIIVNNNDLSWNNSHFRRVYLSKYRSILFNLKNEKNTVFKENVMNNNICTRDIVHMKPEEMFPKVWEDVHQKQLKKEIIRLRNEGKELEEAVEGFYSCAKCNCKKITYYELQTRSADEPMTAYFTCLNCSNRWKE